MNITYAALFINFTQNMSHIVVLVLRSRISHFLSGRYDSLILGGIYAPVAGKGLRVSHIAVVKYTDFVVVTNATVHTDTAFWLCRSVLYSSPESPTSASPQTIIIHCY